MTEHRIRLRRGWECRGVAPPASEVRRIELPVRWSEGDPGRLVLTRRFGRPHLEPGREILILELDQVVGTRAIVLNGLKIAAAATETGRYEIELTELPERNELVLEVDTPFLGAGQVIHGDDWGVISLVIRRIGSTGAPEGPGIAEPIDLE